MKLFVHKIIKSKLLQNAYHEAGHYVLALLFYDKLELNELTINKTRVKTLNKEWAGILHITWHNKPADNDINAGDHMILISLAGICAKTLYTKGRKFVMKNYNQFKSNPKLMNTTGAEDDYKIVQNFSKPISYQIGALHQQIEWSGFFFVYMFFLNEYVWSFVKRIAEQLIKNKSKSLSKAELKRISQETGFLIWIDENKSNILAKRYPLEKKKIRCSANDSFI